MNTQENVISLKNCLEHSLMEFNGSVKSSAETPSHFFHAQEHQISGSQLCKARKMLGSGQESYMKDICQGYREMLSQAVMTNQTCNLPTSPTATLPQTFSPAVKSSLHCTQPVELVLDRTHTRKEPLVEVKAKRGSRVGLWRTNFQDTGHKVNQ